MRLPRTGLNVRALMLLIAGFLIGVACEKSNHHFDVCMKKADSYKSRADESRKEAGILGARIESLERQVGEDGGHDSESRKQSLARFQRYRDEALTIAVECEAMRRKFSKAAFLPFLPLPAEPDLVPPGFFEPDMGAGRMAPLRESAPEPR